MKLDSLKEDLLVRNVQVSYNLNAGPVFLKDHQDFNTPLDEDFSRAQRRGYLLLCRSLMRMLDGWWMLWRKKDTRTTPSSCCGVVRSSCAEIATPRIPACCLPPRLLSAVCLRDCFLALNLPPQITDGTLEIQIHGAK